MLLREGFVEVFILLIVIIIILTLDIFNSNMVDAAHEKKAAQMAMKRQVIASDAVLKDFNWRLNMPLD